MSEIVEKLHALGFVVSKASGNRSLDNGVLLAGQDLQAGAVLGRTVTAGTATGAAAGGNTGNGLISALSVSGAAKEGVYKVTFIEPGANVGTYLVQDPEGIAVGRGAVPGAFASDHVNFTIADGATDFVAGDIFNVKVSQLTVKYKVLNSAGVDGSNKAAAILADAVNAAAADKACVVVARKAEVNGLELVWPVGIAADDKSIAIVELSRLGILVR